MSHQNFKNHSRYIPLWHFITGFALLSILVGSFLNLFYAFRADSNKLIAILLVLVAFVLLSVFWYARWFALRAQDRAIRAEENLRHFVLTGKLLNKKLRTNQIIALRFASDEEFVALAEKAAEEHTRSSSIKKSIKHWRSDHHRV